MKKTLIKDWENFPGHIIPKGKVVEIAPATAKKLIEQGYIENPDPPKRKKTTKKIK